MWGVTKKENLVNPPGFSQGVRMQANPQNAHDLRDFDGQVHVKLLFEADADN